MLTLFYTVILAVVQDAETVPPPRNPPPPGVQLPIDGGLWLLLIAGILFGAYMVYRRNRITNKAS